MGLHKQISLNSLLYIVLAMSDHMYPIYMDAFQMGYIESAISKEKDPQVQKLLKNITEQFSEHYKKWHTKE